MAAIEINCVIADTLRDVIVKGFGVAKCSAAAIVGLKQAYNDHAWKCPNCGFNRLTVDDYPAETNPSTN